MLSFGKSDGPQGVQGIDVLQTITWDFVSGPPWARCTGMFSYEKNIGPRVVFVP